MITRTRLLYTFVFATAAALAVERGLTAVGWSDAQSLKIAEQYFSADYADALPGSGYFGSAVRAQWLGRGPAERANAIRELALSAKRFVSAPGFEKTYDAWVSEHFHGVNHGIKHWMLHRGLAKRKSATCRTRW